MLQDCPRSWLDAPDGFRPAARSRCRPCSSRRVEQRIAGNIIFRLAHVRDDHFLRLHGAGRCAGQRRRKLPSASGICGGIADRSSPACGWETRLRRRRETPRSRPVLPSSANISFLLPMARYTVRQALNFVFRDQLRPDLILIRRRSFVSRVEHFGFRPHMLRSGLRWHSMHHCIYKRVDLPHQRHLSTRPWQVEQPMPLFT